MLIDSSYFVGEYEIDNINGTSPVAVTGAAKLTTFINDYEPEFLRGLLGTALYDEFTAGLLIIPIPDKWTSLRDKIVNTTTKKSPIVAFIWNRYWTAEETKSSSLGQILSKAENATVVSGNAKLVRSWNNSMWGAEVIYDWLITQRDTYPTQDTDVDFFYLTNTLGI